MVEVVIRQTKLQKEVFLVVIKKTVQRKLPESNWK